MKTMTTEKDNLYPGNAFCPLYDCDRQDCKASCLNTVASAAQQLCYCTTEDYEGCPMFLSRLLRNSQPKFRGTLDLAFK